MKKYALFIGRWQTWHEGHQWLIDQQFQKGKNVWIAIRDVNTDKDNPKTAHDVMMELTQKLRGYVSTGRLYISVIPDIESVNYGRGVGYDVIYHEPPTDVSIISGTAIRTGHMKPDGTITYDENKG
jgi:phosphopantetheine adenylyltransferase